ncbi:MAG: hypothetical protein RUMPE_00247 [Eubacteriales bacterium SKADARSKE-1]|nr:hypothetical protein [Eubacteriales bacterium SKADARSKE-1]
MINITKDSLIGDVLTQDPSTAEFFLEIGMHCLGCPASKNETIEQACAVHGVDPNTLIDRINNHLAE